mgnify:CR=1 FL=1
MGEMNLPDWALLTIYRLNNDGLDSPDALHPTPASVTVLRLWLLKQSFEVITEDYEEEFLRLYHEADKKEAT